jgi:ribose transport system permease protein
VSKNVASIEDVVEIRESGPLQRLLGNQAFWITAAIIMIGIVMAFLSDAFLTPNNLFNITRNLSFVGIMALGMTPVIITAGIDLSVGSVMGISGVILGLVLGAGQPMWVGITVGLATALFVGAVNGYLIAYVRLNPFVVTLGMLSLARSQAIVFSQNKMIFDFGPDSQRFLDLGGGATQGIPNPVIALVILAVILWFLLNYTPWGQYVYAVGGNEEAARLTGVPVKWIKMSVYMISALMAGISAVLMVGWLGAVTNALGTGDELRVIAATVIGGANLLGGAGTAYGAVIGAVLIEEIRNALILAGVSAFWNGTFVGLFIILAVFLERVRTYRRA